jgi:hypothetical protein
MIYKQCILTINGNNAKLDEDIYLFRLDKNIELYFTIVNNKYKFNKSDLNNIINLTNASYFQMRLYKNAEVKYTFAIQPTDNEKAILTITDDLIDEPIEVGDYDFQISLLDDDKSSMISLPIVSKQIHVCEPLVTDASETGTAVLGLSTLESGEIVDAFDEEGNYIRKVHVNGELISAELFNKWEEALETNSSNIKTLDSQFKEIANKIDEISNPFNINSFTVSPSTAQKGSTINVTVKWSYNKDINSQTLNNATLDVTLREKTFSSVNADVTYTLNATSTNNISKAKSETVKFYNGIYYGKSSSTTYDSALINSLTKVLSDSKARTITVNAGTREYIYYCLPSRLGTPNFNVGGFDGGFDKVETVSFTNSDGYTENYDIYKSNNANLGNTTIVIK